MRNIRSNSPLLMLTAALLLSVTAPTAGQEGPWQLNLPQSITCGPWDEGHVQGIAIDPAKGHIYFSFTTILVKCDLEGNVLGTVTGLLGHLGCLAFNKEDGRLYGSLEYKDDSIGKGILERTGSGKKFPNGFYVAVFETDRIVSEGMDAEKDSIMTAIFLPDVLADYESGRYGCSGIDGITFGPSLDGNESPYLLTVAYGIYGDTTRTDNDNQVLLQYDTRKTGIFERHLVQDNMPQEGPQKPEGRYYVRTGNTTWGVQNLEYDKFSNCWFLAVYRGKKSQFPNYDFYIVDGDVKADGNGMLTLRKRGLLDKKSGIYGYFFPYGSTGLYSVGDGRFYISEPSASKEGQSCTARIYTLTMDDESLFLLPL